MKDRNDKHAYLKKLSDQLDQKESDIAELKSKVNSVKEDIKAELLKEINALHTKKETLKDKLTQLQEAGDEKWDALKAGAEKSWSEIRDASSKIYARIKQ